MTVIEEAEVLKNDGVIIRYYFGTTVLIPVGTMKREAIELTWTSEALKERDYSPQIGLPARRFRDGNF